MATMNISLPDPMRKFVETRTKQDGYGTISEYFRYLVRVDQKENEKQQQKLEALLLEGINSPSKPLTKADFDNIRKIVKDRLQKSKGKHNANPPF